MEGYALNLSNQQQCIFSRTTELDDPKEGDTVVMHFFHGGYFEGVLEKMLNVEDDDKVGLGFPADNETYCSVYLSDMTVLKEEFETVLDFAAVAYPLVTSEIRMPTEEDAIKIKMKIAQSVAQAIRHAAHDMNIVAPVYMTNPMQDADLMTAISKYYDENFNPSYE